MSKYHIALRSRQTREAMVKYGEQWGSLCEEEKQEAVQCYMYEDALTEYIKLLMEDIFENWYNKWNDTDSTDLYKQIVKDCTKSGRKAVIATAKAEFQELLKDRQETEARNMVKVSAIVDYIDG